MKNKGLKIKGIVLGTISALLLAGCQPTPEDEVIKEKGNLDQVVEEKKMAVDELETDEGAEDLRAQVRAPERAEFSVINSKGNVKIHVDAEIFVPEGNKIPVAEVEIGDIEEAELLQFKKAFFKDGEVAYVKGDESLTEEELKQVIDDLQTLAADNQHVDFSEEIAYYKELLEKVGQQEELDKTEREVTYIWEELIRGEKSFDIEGTVDGAAAFLYIYDRENETPYDKWTTVSYHKETMMEQENPSQIGFDKETDQEYRALEWVYASPYIVYGEDDNVEKEVSENACTYSESEAIAICEKLLSDMGKGDQYGVNKVFPVVETVMKDVTFDNGDTGIQHSYEDTFCGYYIHFGRKINGIVENYTVFSGTNVDDNLANAFSYNYESAAFMVTDEGIISFSLSSPMNQGEIIAEHVQLLSYEEIENIYKSQILLELADLEENDFTYEYEINEIRLGLMRVKNKDSQKEFSLVPVWDFYTSDFDSGCLTINAIDGSIINKGYGY